MGENNWQERIGNQRDWVWRGWQTRYSYKRCVNGSDTPLILLHGFGAAIEHWRKNIPILSEHHSVYALDLLGFGASRKAVTQYSAYLWAQQVHDFWQTFIGKPVILVGNSIGSLVCLTAAATYPDMVKGIAMISLPDVSIRQEMIPKALQPVVAAIESLFASPPLLKSIFQLLRRPGVIRRWAGIAYWDKKAVTDELVEIIAAPPQDLDSDRTFVELFRAVSRPNFAPATKMVLPRLKIPILLLWGKNDRLVPCSLGYSFAPLNPNLEFRAIDRAGHCLHDEYPEKFNTLLLDWLYNNFK